jgi:hypothetical protein
VDLDAGTSLVCSIRVGFNNISVKAGRRYTFSDQRERFFEETSFLKVGFEDVFGSNSSYAPKNVPDHHLKLFG